VLKNNEIVQFKFRFTADNAGFRLCRYGAVSTGGAATLPNLQQTVRMHTLIWIYSSGKAVFGELY
jgi:hypothetical protein